MIQRAARSYGLIDPLDFLARLRNFSQPSEVQEPIELLRAGILFHARGLINTKAIQHNLDWIWPFWVEKQFNPRDSSFIPRGFSFSHVNLTHRNWTAVAHPEIARYPIVDPRGLVTPFFDGWSIDCWIFTRDGQSLIPSKLPDSRQSLHLEGNLEVRTRSGISDLDLRHRVRLDVEQAGPELQLDLEAVSMLHRAWLVIALRPYNPEGIQFIDRIHFDAAQRQWLVNKGIPVHFRDAPDRVLMSNYAEGDVQAALFTGAPAESVSCEVGLATAAALFALEPGESRKTQLRIPLHSKTDDRRTALRTSSEAWSAALSNTARLQIPDSWCRFLYDAAVRTLLFLSAGDVVPGPYTYKRFWFRDGCLMLNALLAVGCLDRSQGLLTQFVRRQKSNGYFQSQKGEWDSNGQVLWVFDRFQRLSGRDLPENWLQALWKGARWIEKKRLKPFKGKAYPGLLPPGFSAEHLGPNDYYYWDNFWSLAGLHCAARLAGRFGDAERQALYVSKARAFEQDIQASLASIAEEKKQGGIPASPNRRLDAGAVGSLVADYPLQLRGPNDEAIARTVDFLIGHCFHQGGFFQDMIHSGVNPYLTLSIAQTLLRNGDPRYRECIRSTAAFASPTGQWPEAVHPFTRGGCMGDGQHGWAAAEWVMIMRNLFVREEGEDLVLGSGLFPEWLESRDRLFFGPTPTPHGPVSLEIRQEGPDTVLRFEAHWREKQPDCRVNIPGFQGIQGVEPGRDYRLGRMNVQHRTSNDE